MDRRLLACALSALVLAVAGCGSSDPKPPPTSPAPAPAAKPKPKPAPPAPAPGKADLTKKPKVAKGNGPAPGTLKIKDLVAGTGPAAKAGSQLRVQYVGVLYKDGKQFDASWDNGKPFDFPLGAGMVIPGWDQGLVGMKVGGRRQLTIPAELAYGPQGSPPTIPPNAPLIFVIDLLAVR